jgi:hypothetical protein
LNPIKTLDPEIVIVSTESNPALNCLDHMTVPAEFMFITKGFGKGVDAVTVVKTISELDEIPPNIKVPPE